MERNSTAARHSWARQHAWLLLNFRPVGQPIYAHCGYLKPTKGPALYLIVNLTVMGTEMGMRGMYFVSNADGIQRHMSLPFSVLERQTTDPHSKTTKPSPMRRRRNLLSRGARAPSFHLFVSGSTEWCKIIPAKLRVFSPIFAKMADLAGCG